MSVKNEENCVGKLNFQEVTAFIKFSLTYG
jgi:hypothetical protein